MSRSITPIKVVFDCMIFLQATANEDSPAAAALDLLDAGEIKLYVSEPILERFGRSSIEMKSARRLNHRRSCGGVVSASGQ